MNRRPNGILSKRFGNKLHGVKDEGRDGRVEKHKSSPATRKKTHDKCDLFTLDVNSKQLWRLIAYNINVKYITHALFAVFMW